MTNTGNYYSGGLAEIIPMPSDITYSFLKEWFTGKGSVGKAMQLLGMPCQKIELPIVELKDGELLVNLKNEEMTIYKKTIFKYETQDNIHTPPKLVIDIRKIIDPLCLLNTFKIIIIQSKWIANQPSIIKTAQKLVDLIPEKNDEISQNEVEEILKERVWPSVVAVGLISEFYSQLLPTEAKGELANINNYISKELAKKDWFFLSVADQLKVKKGDLTFADYIDKYGLRADQDYELTSPRWYEITPEIKRRIQSSTISKKTQNLDLNVNKKLQTLINTSITLQLLRTDARRKALIHIDKLRKFTKSKHVEKVTVAKKTEKKEFLFSGKGLAASQGNVKGTVKNIKDNLISISPKTIGVFPNASPEFTFQYPKCAGIIFLRGGQTSHGAIVAREFGIPAIIDSKAEGIPDNLQVEINGSTGEWHMC